MILGLLALAGILGLIYLGCWLLVIVLIKKDGWSVGRFVGVVILISPFAALGLNSSDSPKSEPVSSSPMRSEAPSTPPTDEELTRQKFCRELDQGQNSSDYTREQLEDVAGVDC
jgi:hypothetical protein